ncbi:carbohydrate esterase family 4 protein [Xylaria intraflava]|nr:carbohydrate esterase family 4 protein [Xylaria intraflava]
MLFASVTALALAAGVSARAVSNPVDIMKRTHVAGTVITQCSKPGVLALAYDDGPYQYTSSLVDTLDAAGVKGTFFYTGTLYGCIYDQSAGVKKAFENGLIRGEYPSSNVGNFLIEQNGKIRKITTVAEFKWAIAETGLTGFSLRRTHPHMASLSAADIQSEMEKVEQAMVNIFGRKPAYMRPPYLETGGEFLSVMEQLNYTVINDDVDTGDWNNQPPTSSEQKFEQAGATGLGHIPLMHETYESTVTTLTSWLIDWAKTNNLEIVTVAECLDDADGMYKEGTFEGDGATTC